MNWEDLQAAITAAGYEFQSLVRLPVKEGWKRWATRANHTGNVVYGYGDTQTEAVKDLLDQIARFGNKAA